MKEKKPDVSGLYTMGGGKELPDNRLAWKLYEKGVAYNSQIDLNSTVRTNENFYIGKQWEGVQANGLPTPVFNVLKRVANFVVASITSDNIKVNASVLSASPTTQSFIEPIRIINEELDALTERNAVPHLMREYARNAAVDGDGCLYTYWDAEEDTGHDYSGAIKTELIENTRVHFGNPSDRRVQTQPYIIIESRAIIGEMRQRAKDNGFEDWANIQSDNDNTEPDSYKEADDKCTVLLLLWRDKKTKHIWGYECTQNCGTRDCWDLGIKRYPITWLNWDYIQDSYHGQAMITGLIPNQIFINRSWAMAQLSLQTTAFPKIIYDKTRVAKWDNRIGSAIGINGGDMNSVARIIDPATISPQISQFIESAVSQTESSLGATGVALGDTRPDNTSAIIALQRAASTPSEITKQNLYQSVEDLYRIYIEFMAEYYGKRVVDVTTPPDVKQMYVFAGQSAPAEVPAEFDFDQVKKMPIWIKLDVGASSYYSEIASIQTLDNLLQLGKISTKQYLERIPDGYIPARRELISELEHQEEQAMMMQMPQGMEMPTASDTEPAQGYGGAGEVTNQNVEQKLPQGGGYSALQRKINAGEQVL